MKKYKFFIVISLFTIHCSLFTSYSKSRQDMTDSTKYNQIKQDSIYAVGLGIRANLFYLSGKMDSAIHYQKIQLDLRRNLFKGAHHQLAASIHNMARFKNENGNYEEAGQLYKEALEMFHQLFKDDNPQLASSINSLAYFYFNIGNFKEAEPLFKEALEMRRRLFRGDHPNLATSIINIANFYREIGNNKEAEPLFKEALDMLRRICKGDNDNLATGINNMASFYNDIGNFKEAEPLYKETLEMRRRLFKDDHTSLAISINNMALFYYEKGDSKSAEPLFKEALEMNRRLFKGDHPDLANCINNLAYFYKGIGNNKEAELLYMEALGMKRRLFKNDHPDLASTIINIADFYDESGRYAEAEPLFIEALEVYFKVLSNYFPSLSEKEKKQFWNTMNWNFEGFNSFAVKRAKENPYIICDMYNNQLATKALLLNSTNKVKNRILNSGDSVMISQYRSWSDMKQSLIELYKLTNDSLNKLTLGIDSIENSANELEKQISIKSEAFAQSYEKKKVTWKSIQTLLKPDEAAVEVVRFQYYDKRWTDTIYYAFLIVTDQTEDHPDIIVFENGNQLENEFYSFYRNGIKHKLKESLSYGRYWEKLFDKLKIYKKIYFSADGIYNKLNPLTLMHPDGRYLFDIQDIQQVNSTKDLLIGYYKSKQESSIYNSALLIGDPNFSLSEEQTKVASKKIRKDIELESSYETLASIRGDTLVRLPGTKKEVNNIELFLKSKKWIVNSYLGDMALKSAVKAANNPRVLHIATHGLFLENVKKNTRNILGFDENRMIENPLLRSGLFFTGANNYYCSDKVSLAEEENGILTAYEAMNLNLDKTELVVLSACETGLGEIENGEGVFGLQRAFQQAGAKSVIMSLWKVSDNATQELMSSFYKNWVTGMSKREAFCKAQLEIKNKYPEPYYWGAFVMVGE